jgi:hypothetical protein
MEKNETPEVMENPKPLEVEKKREVLSIQLTPEEKRTITRMAVQDCGISVSEFVRTKIFADPKKMFAENINESPITDEEREIYENKLSDVNKQMKVLKEELINLRVSIANPNLETLEEAIKPVTDNELSIQFSADAFPIIESIRKFREEQAAKLDDKEKEKYYGYNKYLIAILIRGFRRSYFNGELNINTGLTTDDMKLMAKVENIDYDNL